MKSYPYIGKTELGSIVLFHKESAGRVIKHIGSIPTGRVDDDWCELDFKNITPKYLANTYGEVVSPEHAEFIIELAIANDIEVCTSFRDGLFFNFYKKQVGGKLVLFFFREDKAKEEGEKQITIPLPPKQIQTATPEEEFEMKQIMKNAGDNLVLGCEQDFKVARDIINELREEANCSDELLASHDEWPKIGDEVLVYSSARRLAEIKGKAIKVIGKCNHSDGDTILTVEHSSLGVFAVTEGSWIKKPKTPEEELRDEIVNLINYAGSFSDEVVADALMSKYNITKKPQ